jgi:Flagellar biosynthesis protein, FliO
MPDHAFTVRLIVGFVVCLMIIGLALLWIEFLDFTGVLRRRSRGGAASRSKLAVIEVAMIDQSRRLLLVRRDQTEHLVVVGGPNDVVLESRIIRDTLALTHQAAMLVPPAPEPVALISPPPESPAAKDSDALRLLVELTTT